MDLLTVALLATLAAAGLFAVMSSLLLRAAIALAFCSAALTAIMFRLGAPIAGVFELSVCSGLISVIFIAVISLTHRLPRSEYLIRRASRVQRFRYLPLFIILAGMAVFFFAKPFPFNLPPAENISDVRAVMWNLRKFDLFGQILVLLAGVFGVLVLFRGKNNNGK